MPDAALPPILTDWFAGRGWRPRRHQLEMLAAARAGDHALLVAATGGSWTKVFSALIDGSIRNDGAWGDDPGAQANRRVVFVVGQATRD